MNNNLSQSHKILFLNTLAFTICFACWTLNGVLVTYLVDKGIFDFSVVETGWLLGIPVLTGSILRLPIGIMTDKYGGKYVYAGILLLCSIPLFLLPLANSFFMFAVLSFLFGIVGTSFAVGILLKKENIYNKVKDKIVWGENIGQTAQFAYSGNAEVGFIALSQALTPEMKAKGKFIEFPEEVSPKIAQAAVLIKKENTHQAQLFLNYVLSPSCKELWTKHGYETNKVRKP